MNKINNWLARYVVKYYFHGVMKEDVLQIMDDTMKLNGVTISKEMRASLIASAARLKDSKTHRAIKRILTLKANDHLFRHSTEKDQTFPRACIWFIEEYDLILEDISKLDS